MHIACALHPDFPELPGVTPRHLHQSLQLMREAALKATDKIVEEALYEICEAFSRFVEPAH